MWPLEMRARRSKRPSRWTSYWRRRISLVAGPNPREAGHLGQVGPEEPLVRPPRTVVVAEPLQRPAYEDVGRVTVGQDEVGRLVAVEEGANLLQGADPFGAKRHDHASMISSPRASGSPPGGNPSPVQAHFPLDKTEGGAGSKYDIS